MGEASAGAGEEGVDEGDDAVDEVGPALRRWGEVGHPVDHRGVGSLSDRHVRQCLGHRDHRLPSMCSDGGDVSAKFGCVELVSAAGDPEVGEVAVTGAGLASLHRGDDLLGEVERERVGTRRPHA